MNMTVVQRSNRTLHFLHQPVRAEADGAAHGCTRHSRAADAGLSPGKALGRRLRHRAWSPAIAASPGTAIRPGNLCDH